MSSQFKFTACVKPVKCGGGPNNDLIALIRVQDSVTLYVITREAL